MGPVEGRWRLIVQVPRLIGQFVLPKNGILQIAQVQFVVYTFQLYIGGSLRMVLYHVEFQFL